MTSATVTNNNSYLINATNHGANGAIQSTLGQDFTQVMGKATKPHTQTNQDVKTSKDTHQEETFVDKSKQQAMQDKIHNVREAKKMQPDTQVERKVTDKAQELLSQVSDKLGVSEEEVLAAMQTLGMSMSQLLDPDSMTQLVVSLSGETDMMSLVMDENLYGKLTDLLKTVDAALTELQSQLGVTKDALSDLLGQMEMQEQVTALEQSMEDTLPDSSGTQQLSEEQPKVSVTNEMPADTHTKDMVTAEQAQAGTTGKQDIQSVLTQATKEVEEGVLSATAVEEQPEEETSADQTQIQDLSMDKEIQTQPKTQQGAMQQNHTNQENNAQHDTSNDVAFLQNLMNRATNIRPEVTVTAPPQIVDTESILKQMMDYMKLHISPNITEMEIQLQPANLGSINLQVATRNGVVTAQLTAETEAVKKALESQVVQLRESLNEQGIKIEAVEVTIASHSFERNLEQGGDSTPYEDTDSTTKGNGRSKRLVLGELDEEAEAELEEEDKIQVQMMKQNGNSVNLTA